MHLNHTPWRHESKCYRHAWPPEEIFLSVWTPHPKSLSLSLSLSIIFKLGHKKKCQTRNLHKEASEHHRKNGHSTFSPNGEEERKTRQLTVVLCWFFLDRDSLSFFAGLFCTTPRPRRFRGNKSSRVLDSYCLLWFKKKILSRCAQELIFSEFAYSLTKSCVHSIRASP